MKKLSLLALIASMWGCTEERFSSVPKYQISFSGEVALDFSEVGMSSEVPFSISPLDNNNKSFLVFNNFYRRLDTVFFSLEKNRIVAGLEIPKDGPSSIPGFSTFIQVGQRNVFLTGNSIYYLKNGETVKFRLENAAGKFNAIRGSNPKNKVAYLSSFDDNYLYFINEDPSYIDLSLYRLNFDSESFEEIPFDFADLTEHIISYKNGPATATNAYFPFITLSDSVLILSYPFTNQISKIDLDSFEQIDYIFNSDYFKSEKELPAIKGGFKNIADFIEASYKWDEDIYFGSVYILNTKLKYRVVFDYGKSSNLVYLELFNNSFEKVGEYDLTAIESELKYFHITVDGKILIQSSKDPDEDIFKYYLISVDEI